MVAKMPESQFDVIETVEASNVLQLVLRSGIDIKLESAVIVRANGREHTVDPVSESDARADLLRQLQSARVRFSWTELGELTLDFEGGMRITSGSVPNFEAWSVNEPNGMLVVAMPGGGVNTYGPPEPM
jgi:hypothetical protein